ncbi:hypothetical protein [Streptacidiphilus sp. EB103A]|uniref:hypothetical protein n=1 Tax=Streptacidiphilus sp. EB103A TaxID=3156275 RepID=UPI003511AB92
MAVESASRRPGLARLFAVPVLLVGLFLMHGAPTAAMGDCHESMALTSMALTLPGTHPMAAAVHTASTASVQTQRQSETASGSQGTSCVTTPVRGHLTLPAPVLLFAVLVALAVLIGAGRLGGARSARRRGPPPTGGRQILLQVCIART